MIRVRLEELRNAEEAVGNQSDETRSDVQKPSSEWKIWFGRSLAKQRLGVVQIQAHQSSRTTAPQELVCCPVSNMESVSPEFTMSHGINTSSCYQANISK
jgi:hypothetical protein